MADEKCDKCGGKAVWNWHGTELWCVDECEKTREAEIEIQREIIPANCSGSYDFITNFATSWFLPNPYLSGTLDLGTSHVQWTNLYLDEDKDITINGVDYRFVSGALERKS